MSEYKLEERAAAAHRTVDEQRRFERAYADAGESLRRVMSESRPTSPFVAEPERRQLVAPVPVHAMGDRGRWQRDTWGGRISRLFTAADEAGELQAAKALCDEHELTYGSRPDMGYFLHKVRGSGTGPRVVLEGETAEVVGQIRLVAPDQPVQMVVGPAAASSQVGGVVSAPGRGPEATGDPAIAEATLGQLARRQ